jgi:hypothetical protein
MRLFATLCFAMLGLLSTGPTLQAQSPVACGAPSASSASGAAGVRRLISGSAPSDSAWRASVKLPAMSASSVVFVTSDSLCDVAARAVANLSSPAAPIQPVWLLSAGPNRYVVFGSGRMSADRLLGSLFDSTFTWLADFFE